MGLLGWLVMGALAGWLASKVTGNDAKMGAGANIVVGIVGAFIGGFIANNLLNIGNIAAFNLQTFLIAFGGAVLLLVVVNAVSGRR